MWAWGKDPAIPLLGALPTTVDCKLDPREERRDNSNLRWVSLEVFE